MRVCVVAVGKLRDGALKDLFAAYTKRLPWKLTVIEVAERGSDPPPVRVQRESEDLCGRLPDGPVFVLDESGIDLSSEELAQLIRRYRDEGIDTITFAIGGADGHAAETRDRADHVIAFGNATWPHQLVRVMLAEQLYRASTILAGHPYHRR